MRSFFVAMVMTVGCFLNGAKAGPAPANREQMLLGTWSAQHQKEGYRIEETTTFRPGGKAISRAMIWKDAGAKSVLVQEMSCSNRWKLEGNQMVSYEISTKPEGLIPANTVTRDEILSFAAKEIRVKTESGSIVVYKKLD